jgi:outer membrane protein assembly factor BamB
MGNEKEVDYVYCVDGATGALLWRYGYPCSSADPMGYKGPRCTPTVDEGRVYTLSRTGDLFCLSLDNGKMIWKHQMVAEYGGIPPQWGFSCSPLVEGNLCIVEAGAVGQSLIAFNKETGRLIWANGLDLPAYSSPVAYDFGGQRCVADFSAASLTARDVKNGRILWRFPWKTSYDVNAATPIMFSDKAFISSGYDSGCALLQFDESGQPHALWSNKNMRNHFSSCVLWEGHLYGFDESELRCLDLFNGSVNWSTPSMGKGSLMLADGKLIVFGESGRLAIASAVPTGYKELAATQATGGRSTWAPPVLCHSRIYCRAHGTLVCLDVTPPPLRPKK